MKVLVSLIAESSGIYRLEVRSLEREAKGGHYEVRIGERRVPTAQDKSRVAAQKAYAEGERLLAQGVAESLRNSIERYKEALSLYREIGDRRGESATLSNIGRVQ